LFDAIEALSLSELGGRKAGGLLEGDAEAVGAEVAAHAGKHVNFLIGPGQEFLGSLDANAMEPVIVLPQEEEDATLLGFHLSR
jgi:hypothetical protein